MHLQRVTALCDLATAAALRGGECLEASYLGWRRMHRWRCAEGHTWRAPPQKVIAGHRTWCPECAGVATKSLADVRELARALGGECLADRYENNDTPMPWRCEKGHRWTARARAVLAGHWCPLCANRDRPGRRLTLEELQENAAERGGRLLSTSYQHNRERLLWECASGHEFEATARSVRQGSWCPGCAGRWVSIERFRALAVARGGECLSTQYVNSRTKLRWQCAKGHIWSALPQTIAAGSWCGRCAKGGRKPGAG